MKNKVFLIFTGFLGLICGLYFLLASPRVLSHDRCAFCTPSVVQNQAFYEDHLVSALYTHKPILPGHCLIIPKRHVERFEELTDEEMAHIGRVIQKVNRAVVKTLGTSSYLLLQKNGLEVGQSVPHVHFHYVPRHAGDSSALKFLVHMYLAYLKAPLSEAEMQERIDSLKHALTSDGSGFQLTLE